MLIIVPPSEAKRPPAPSGAPVDLERLSFPELTDTRRRVAEALVRTSSSLDAFRRLQVRESMAPAVAANTHLFELPAVPVLDLYTGPVHEGLDAAGLSRAAAARAEVQVVVNSALWGLLRPADRIPSYRLQICAHLIGVEDLEPVWREVVPDALAGAAGSDGLIVDIRSPVYQATGMPKGLGDRTVWVRVDMGPPGHRIGEVIAKRIRGAAAHALLESSADPVHPAEVAELLGARWGVRLEPPVRSGKPWTLSLSSD
ncbi:MAG TPA: peroxide stress protein YaaA [Candidatus Limnocylindrales bacterium]|nr:peroxide stress protein YaaA [Candidatus Limnocylindrales bacterium]